MEQQVFDLTNLPRTYFKQALPVVLGLVVTLVYNLADTFFVAQTGVTALVAGVSLCSPVFTALMAFGNIYGQGGSSLISRLLGNQDEASIRRISSFCFYIAILTGVILAAPMLFFRQPLLMVLGSDTDTLPHAAQYLCILAACSPLIILSFIHSNLLRCEGLAVQSMIGTSSGALLNIVLDPILISVLRWGAAGAATATVLGYAFSDAFFLFILKKHSRFLSVDPKQCKVNGSEVRQIFGVGFTAAITNLMSSMCMIVVNQFLLRYGSDKIAAMGIVLKVNMIAQLILTGFAFGGVALFGYLYGAKDMQRLKRLVRFCLTFQCGLSAVLSAALFVAAPLLMRGFIDVQSIVADGTVMLRWQTAGNMFAAVVLLMTCLFQATGKVAGAFALSISRQGIVFLLVLVVAVQLAGYNGLIAAQAVADLISAALALGLYKAAFTESGVPTP